MKKITLSNVTFVANRFVRAKQLSVATSLITAIILAFAFTSTTKQLHCYGVGSSTATHFILVEEIDGEVEGIHYRCDPKPSSVCTVCTATLYTTFPVAVPKSNVTVPGSSLDKKFVDLDPNNRKK